MPRESSLPYRDCVRRPHALRPADGRRARLGPIAFWVTVGALLTMAGWSITGTTYSAFREDVHLRTQRGLKRLPFDPFPGFQCGAE